MSKVVELFGHSAFQVGVDWKAVVAAQRCGYLGKKCYKTRKSDSSVAIGSCTVMHKSDDPAPIIICPTRLIERRQIFIDCLHLLTTHEPGNELHVLSEIRIPGGKVDYFLVSMRDGKVKDFVGIELQTMDTTGTVWPERQRLLRDLDVARHDNAEESNSKYHMNWKMTAKTILVQMHHKILTFEHVHKKLVLVLQDHLLNYMRREFKFDHLHAPAAIGDSMHIHEYGLDLQADRSLKLGMRSRLSTDADGIGICLDLQTEAKVELELIVNALQSKISDATLFSPV